MSPPPARHTTRPPARPPPLAPRPPRSPGCGRLAGLAGAAGRALGGWVGAGCKFFNPKNNLTEEVSLSQQKQKQSN